MIYFNLPNERVGRQTGRSVDTMAAVVVVAANSNSGGTSQKTAARLGYCNRRRKKK